MSQVVRFPDESATILACCVILANQDWWYVNAEACSKHTLLVADMRKNSIRRMVYRINVQCWHDSDHWHCIWIPLHLDRIRQNRTYWYVPVHGSTWIVTLVHESTCWYVRVRTFERTCGLLTHPGSVLKALQCFESTYARDTIWSCQISQYAKFRETQYIMVHTGSYWYVLVPKNSSFESYTIRFPTPTSLHALDLFLVPISHVVGPGGGQNHVQKTQFSST